MSYRIEGKDIVIDGFDKGIADTPFSGIADMRNLDITSYPGEASVSFSEVAVTAPPALNAEAFTAPGYQSVTYVSASSATNDTDTSTTLQWSHTVAAGTNRALVVAISDSVIPAQSTHGTCTFGAQNMTKINTASIVSPSNGMFTEFYLLIAPTVSTANITITRTLGIGYEGSWCGAAANYIGVKPTGQPDANSTAVTSANAGTLTSTITSIIDNCKAILASATDKNATQTGGGTLTERRDQQGEDCSIALYESTAVISPAGLLSMQTTDSSGGTGNLTHNAITLAPVAGTGAVDTFVWDGAPTGLYTGCALQFNSLTDTQSVVTGKVYYIEVVTSTTFKLHLIPACSDSAIVITVDVSGTFTVFQYGNQRAIGSIAPVARYVNETSLAASGPNGIYLTDASNYAWVILSAASGSLAVNTLYYLGNIGGIGNATASITGIAVWQGYLIMLGPPSGSSSAVSLDAADITDLFSAGPLASWQYNFTTASTLGGLNGRIDTVVSAEDGNLYFTTTSGVGSLIEEPGQTFDPGTGATFSITASAVILPDNDRSTCICEFGINLLIGARGKFLYMWDKISLSGFTGLINLSESFVSRIVATSSNAYIFSGVRGRIFITNGSNLNLFKKMPDYLTGIVAPYITWFDASSARDQIYFSMLATTNADATNATIGGAWAIDLKTEALRMINKSTNSDYGQTTPMVVEMPRAAGGGTATAPIFTDNIPGTGVVIGWYSGSTYGVDNPSSTPYSNYESFLDTDIIPVGTCIDPLTPSQIEWKTSAPIVTGEGVKISYRTNISDSFTLVGESTTAGVFSDVYQTNFQKAQWVQLRVNTKSTASSPSYTRLTEVRIRDWPSGKNST